MAGSQEVLAEPEKKAAEATKTNRYLLLLKRVMIYWYRSEFGTLFPIQSNTFLFGQTTVCDPEYAMLSDIS